MARTGRAGVGAALQGRESVERVEDSVLGRPGLEVVVPARAADGRVVGAVRITYPLQPITDQLRAIWSFRLLVGLGTLGIATLIAVQLARSLTRPLSRLDEMAARMTSLDNLADEISTPATQRVLDQITAEVTRMNRLVNDLLLLARAQVDPARPTPVSLSAMVDARLRVWSAAATGSDIELVTSVPPAHRARVTAEHLHQILDNLLDNAIAVAPPGTAVEISTTAGHDEIVLQVADRGPGMTAEQRARAFDRFWRGRPGGTGLGLSIVEQLVEQNRGTVALGDRPGGGLVVSVGLPRAR